MRSREHRDDNAPRLTEVRDMDQSIVGTYFRASSNYDESEIYDDSCLRIEHKSYFVACQGKPLSLSRTEFLILSRLIRGINRIVSINELWSYAWGFNKPLKIKSLHVFISRLRSKLSPFGIRLDSVFNVGYILSHDGCCDSRKGVGPADRA